MAELRAQPRLTPEEKQRLATLEQTHAAANKDPDFLEDPKGYIDAKSKEVKDALKKLDEAETSRNQRESAQREWQDVVTNVGTKEQEFLKTTPDYNDALTHLRGVRAQQLQLLYPQATAQQIQQQIGIEEIQSARQILQSGGNPAQFAYAYAKTLGYAPKAVAAADTTTTTTTTAAKQPVIDKDAARSLGGGGGADSMDEPDEGTMPELQAALAERFGVKPKKR